MDKMNSLGLDNKAIIEARIGKEIEEIKEKL